MIVVFFPLSTIIWSILMRTRNCLGFYRIRSWRQDPSGATTHWFVGYLLEAHWNTSKQANKVFRLNRRVLSLFLSSYCLVVLLPRGGGLLRFMFSLRCGSFPTLILLPLRSHTESIHSFSVSLPAYLITCPPICLFLVRLLVSITFTSRVS